MSPFALALGGAKGPANQDRSWPHKFAKRTSSAAALLAEGAAAVEQTAWVQQVEENDSGEPC